MVQLVEVPRVSGSISDGVVGFFIDLILLVHYGLGVDTSSNGNVYLRYLRGVRRPVRRADNLATFLC